MSTNDDTTQQDKPEYIRGDVIDVFDPESKDYKWIEVEEIIEGQGAQILVFGGCYFCACWVRQESIGAPGLVESIDERKEVD
jgi:hypothetical protein